MTASFMDQLNAKQRDVFGRICIGQDVGGHPRTLAVLAERGLIVGYRELLDGHPPVEVVRWDVPIHVHIEWAQWYSEQPDADTDG